MNCCIVIPVYKLLPSYVEEAALKQVITVLSDYRVHILCPKDFDTTAYIKIFEKNRFFNFEITRFKNSYFSSLDGYNKLLLSVFFYKRFRSYTYMLIYQLDAWIFKNELAYWCNQNYDYIGAPWFDGFNLAKTDSKPIGVGNGGFSLRKIRSYIKVLTSFAVIRPYKQLWNTFTDEITPRSAFAYILRMTILNNTFFLMNDYVSQEDHFWGLIIPRKYEWFKVPDPISASRFAMEVNADQLYEHNGNILPFGCHAWEKYNSEFWKRFISI